MTKLSNKLNHSTHNCVHCIVYLAKYLLNRVGNSSRVTQECHECNKHEIWHASQALTCATCNVKMFCFFGCWELGLLSWEFREVVAAAETADLAQLLFDSARSNLQHWRTEKWSGANGAVSSESKWRSFLLLPLLTFWSKPDLSRNQPLEPTRNNKPSD